MRWNSRSCWSLLVMVTLGQAVPATACTLFAPFGQLPGETVDAYALRASSLLAAQYDEERRLWQQNNYDRAERVFIGRVVQVKSAATATAPGRRMLVQPLRALKGQPPSSVVSVQDVRSLSCQGIVGGVRKSAADGDYTIVFMGSLSPQGGTPSIKEIPIHEARDPRLVAAIMKF